jgi:hypothetical protein
MPLVNFWKKFRFFSFVFARISKFEHFRGDWAYTETNFVGEISKKIFSQMFTWVLLDGFFKIWIFYSRNLHFNLGFLSNFRKL